MQKETTESALSVNLANGHADAGEHSKQRRGAAAAKILYDMGYPASMSIELRTGTLTVTFSDVGGLHTNAFNQIVDGYIKGESNHA